MWFYTHPLLGGEAAAACVSKANKVDWTGSTLGIFENGGPDADVGFASEDWVLVRGSAVIGFTSLRSDTKQTIVIQWYSQLLETMCAKNGWNYTSGGST